MAALDSALLSPSRSWRQPSANDLAVNFRPRRKPDAFVRLLTLIVVLCVAAASSALGAEPADKAIDEAVLLQFPKDPHSGFSVTIVHGGRLVYAKGFGFRDDGTPDTFIPKDQNYYGMPIARAHTGRAKADPRTIYALGSVTKQFTAAAILLLSERGKLGIDDPVNRYVPEFAASPLTLRMLLMQRSGLPDLNTLTFLQRVRPEARRSDGSYDEAKVNREIAKLPRDFAPGAQFEYSNSNYFVLGTIVESVAHEPLGGFLAANIFRPLGMTRTAYATTAATDDVAIGYRVDEGGKVRRAYPWDLGWVGGAGAMTSTAQDMARWNIALLGHRVLAPDSLAQMWQGESAGRGQGSYAMGWIEDAIGTHRYLWHNGEVGGFHALNVIFPADDLAFSILSNNQDARPEYLIPAIASLYFPVGGLDRILPRSGVVIVQASIAIGIGALAIAVVALGSLKRFVPAGIAAAVLALVIGFFLPAIIGYVWGGLAALLPTAAYVVAVRFVPKKPTSPPLRKMRSRS
jgi:CubicO group peptidase (beta-lactamase class C family)